MNNAGYNITLLSEFQAFKCLGMVSKYVVKFSKNLINCMYNCMHTKSVPIQTYVYVLVFAHTGKYQRSDTLFFFLLTYGISCETERIAL